MHILKLYVCFSFELGFGFCFKSNILTIQIYNFCYRQNGKFCCQKSVLIKVSSVFLAPSEPPRCATAFTTLNVVVE